MIFKKSAKKPGVFTQNKAKYAKFWSWHWFLEKRQFFRRKLSKSAEKCGHNIDPQSYERFPRRHLGSLERFL
jgi:hypothetical protein